MRLQLSDAAKAVSSLLYVRRYTPDSGKRFALTMEAMRIAEDALAMLGEGRTARGRFQRQRRQAERQRSRVEVSQ
ncbi:hypothetical protein ACGF5M_03095 [Gemmatimonadota bacterium]